MIVDVGFFFVANVDGIPLKFIISCQYHIILFELKTVSDDGLNDVW